MTAALMYSVVVSDQDDVLGSYGPYPTRGHADNAIPVLKAMPGVGSYKFEVVQLWDLGIPPGMASAARGEVQASITVTSGTPGGGKGTTAILGGGGAGGGVRLGDAFNGQSG